MPMNFSCHSPFVKNRNGILPLRKVAKSNDFTVVFPKESRSQIQVDGKNSEIRHVRENYVSLLVSRENSENLAT